MRGATAAEWRLAVEAGLLADLLPAVPDPMAPLSPRSRLRSGDALPKTPSLMTPGGAVGLSDWSRRTTDIEDALDWAGAGYNLLIQTRRVRAVDIDCDDPVMAGRLARWWRDALARAAGIPGEAGNLPARMREGSPRVLLPFRLSDNDPLGKRILRLPGGGAVEILGTGQQFLAFGVHPSGVRLSWQPVFGLGPVIDRDALDDMTEAFAAEFGATTTARAVVERHAEVSAGLDDLGRWLLANWECHGLGTSGQIFVKCPWGENHSKGVGDHTSSAWFPAGSGGFERGHFVCLHNSCAERTDEDFFDAVGWRLSSFEIQMQKAEKRSVAAGGETGSEVGEVESQAAEVYEADPWPAFLRDRNGRIEATLTNVVAALASPVIVGGALFAFDDATAQEVKKVVGRDKWEFIEDEDLIKTRILLEGIGFKPITRDLMRDAFKVHTSLNVIDTRKEWLSGLTWDGVPRISETFLDGFCMVAQENYAVACGEYLWTAAAGRTLVPGEKTDMMPVLVGSEGIGKTTGVELMCPNLLGNTYAKLDFSMRDADAIRLIIGALFVEVEELRGLNTRDSEYIKAFLTRKVDSWVPKYRERPVNYKRRCIFVGTTNEYEFLDYSAGLRRYLPLIVETVNRDWLEANREQLWAEGAALYSLAGVLYEGADRRAKVARLEAQVKDAWVDILYEWLNTTNTFTGVKPCELDVIPNVTLFRALNLDSWRVNPNAYRRLRAAMERLGYEPARNKNVRGYRRVAGRSGRAGDA